MEITLRIDTQYGASGGSQRQSDVRVLDALAKALDVQAVDVDIYSAPHNADRARQNCAVADNVDKVSNVDVGASFADAKGEAVNSTDRVYYGEDQARRDFISPAESDATGTEPKTDSTPDASPETTEDKPKRKRRTKKEMEAARAAEAEDEATDPRSAPVDDAIDAALKTLDDATGTDLTTEPTPAVKGEVEGNAPTTEVEVDSATAMRDIMVKFVKRFQSKGTLIMARIVEDLTGETNILKVSEKNFGLVFDALNARLEEPEATPEATTEKENDLDY